VSFLAFVSLQAAVRAGAQPHELIGIRAQGMAGAFVAVADDATATWWNPAGLPNALFSATAEVDKGDGFGFAVSIPQFGLSYYRTPISEIRPLDSTASLGPGRQDLGAAGIGLSSSIDQFGATVGQSIGEHVVVATTLKLIHALSETTGDLDVGAMARFGALRLGVSVRNVTEPTFGGESLRVPRRVRAGAALSGRGRGSVDELTLSLDVDVTSATSGVDRQGISGGAEAWMLAHRLAVRGGGGADLESSEGFGAAGLSVAVRKGMFVDAAITRGGAGEFGDRWGVGFRVSY